MNDIFGGVRTGDAVLAALLTAAGVLLMVENITTGDAALRIDSRSWWMVPLFAVATVPVLWRRRSMIGVLSVTTGALVAHVLAFGWVTRCGAGLPLAIALAYGAGRLMRGTSAWAGLVATLAIQFLVLVRDSAAGLDIIPVTAVLGAVAFGIGLWLARRDRQSSPLDAPVAAAARV
jgi:hypothetical protein